MKFFVCILFLMVALLPSTVKAGDYQIVCAKTPMFSISGVTVSPAIAGTYVRGRGALLNPFVTVKISDQYYIREQDVSPDGQFQMCTCLCEFAGPVVYYYADEPTAAANLMTSNQFFRFISSTRSGIHMSNYDSWIFEQPRVIKLTPRTGASFYAVVSKMVRTVESSSFSFYAGYEVSSPPVEVPEYTPCAALTQGDDVMNLTYPGLLQVQLDPSDALNSIALIRLARNTSASRQISNCSP